jgi:hypothetical protein
LKTCFRDLIFFPFSAEYFPFDKVGVAAERVCRKWLHTGAGTRLGISYGSCELDFERMRRRTACVPALFRGLEVISTLKQIVRQDNICPLLINCVQNNDAKCTHFAGRFDGIRNAPVL